MQSQNLNAIDEIFNSIKPEFIKLIKSIGSERWHQIQEHVDVTLPNHLAKEHNINTERIDYVAMLLRQTAIPLLAKQYLTTLNPPDHLFSTNRSEIRDTIISKVQTYQLPTWPELLDAIDDIIILRINKACKIGQIDDAPPSTRVKIRVHQSPPAPEVEPASRQDVDDSDPLYLASIFLPMLARSRFSTPYYWIDIGRVLFNLTDGSDKGLHLWSKFSAREHDVSECSSIYSSLQGSPLTVKTLAFYAKADNLTLYDQWHRDWRHETLTTSLSGFHTDVAHALYRVFWLDYLCVDSKNSIWYKFTDPRLYRLDAVVDLEKDITNKFIPVFEMMRAKASKKVYEDLQGQDIQKKELETLIQQCTKLIKDLKTMNYQSNVIKAARQFFHLYNFDKLIDVDPYKTGWKNCVVEICQGVAYPRPGKPEDFITMSTGVKINPTLHPNHPKVRELLGWLGQVFVDPELLLYFCKDVASFLQGLNSEKYFRVWTGDTNNSKSMIIKLIQATLGQYVFDLPVTLFSNKALVSGSGPNPELAQARGTHIGIAVEPDGDEEFKGGMIKRQTGGDRFFARNCNENGGSIAAIYKIIVMCNRIPNVPNLDLATMERFFILMFLSKWVDDPPADIEEQYRTRTFKKDRFFEKKIPDLAEAFAWLMITYFPTYIKEGLEPPQIVKDYIIKHWKERDPYRAFITDCVMTPPPIGGAEDLRPKISIVAAYSLFKKWYAYNYPRFPVATMEKFRDEMLMAGRLGPVDVISQQWIGKVLQTPEFVNKPQSSSKSTSTEPNDPLTTRLRAALNVSIPRLTEQNVETHNRIINNSDRDEDLRSEISRTTNKTTASQARAYPYIEEWSQIHLIVLDDYNDSEFTFISDLFSNFEIWFASQYTDQQCPIKRSNEFGRYLTKIYPDRHRDKKQRMKQRGAAMLGISMK
jgi:phage/plasmid-associated DNA primase